jgi:16S rRNA (guanine527-N7)-methyltransferase
LARLGLEPGSADKLATYLDLMAHWSAHVNLTGARTAEQRVLVLVEPVLQGLPAMDGARDLLDLGSGNGSPGLVLAILCPPLRVRLLEPRLKRWAFLREAARTLGCARVEVLRERHDQHRGPAADRVSVRALSLPPADVAPLLRPGGKLLCWGPPWEALAGWEVESRAPGLQVARRCFT